jgi:hypothetical protein
MGRRWPLCGWPFFLIFLWNSFAGTQLGSEAPAVHRSVTKFLSVVLRCLCDDAESAPTLALSVGVVFALITALWYNSRAASKRQPAQLFLRFVNLYMVGFRSRTVKFIQMDCILAGVSPMRLMPISVLFTFQIGVEFGQDK